MSTGRQNFSPAPSCFTSPWKLDTYAAHSGTTRVVAYVGCNAHPEQYSQFTDCCGPFSASVGIRAEGQICPEGYAPSGGITTDDTNGKTTAQCCPM